MNESEPWYKGVVETIAIGLSVSLVLVGFGICTYLIRYNFGMDKERHFETQTTNVIMSNIWMTNPVAQ